MDVSVLLEPTIDLPRLCEILDGMGHEGRVHTMNTFNKQKQRALFDAAKGFRAMGFEFLVPSSLGPLVGVTHAGHNSLPSPFSHFQKHFCRLPVESPASEQLAGYNEQSMELLTGPGYFSVTKGEGEREGELAFDYTSIPSVKPEGWPPIVGNDGFLSGIVNGGMTDYVRAISAHVIVGAAFKNGTPKNEFFTLVRKDLS